MCKQISKPNLTSHSKTCDTLHCITIAIADNRQHRTSLPSHPARLARYPQMRKTKHATLKPRWLIHQYQLQMYNMSRRTGAKNQESHVAAQVSSSQTQQIVLYARICRAGLVIVKFLLHDLKYQVQYSSTVASALPPFSQATLRCCSNHLL